MKNNILKYNNMTSLKLQNIKLYVIHSNPSSNCCGRGSNIIILPFRCSFLLILYDQGHAESENDLKVKCAAEKFCADARLRERAAGTEHIAVPSRGHDSDAKVGEFEHDCRKNIKLKKKD